GATIDVTRELIEVDCGSEYIALDDSDQQTRANAFATELLAKRLSTAGYKGTPTGLLGSSHWAEGSLGRALRDRQNSRNDDQYHVLECIATLCSGDISALLLVYRRIFEKGGVTKTAIATVPKHVQHAAIESVSRELFQSVRNNAPLGEEMYAVVANFGALV